MSQAKLHSTRGRAMLAARVRGGFDRCLAVFLRLAGAGCRGVAASLLDTAERTTV
jgi:hypothetical protein